MKINKRNALFLIIFLILLLVFCSCEVNNKSAADNEKAVQTVSQNAENKYDSEDEDTKIELETPDSVTEEPKDHKENEREENSEKDKENFGSKQSEDIDTTDITDEKIMVYKTKNGECYHLSGCPSLNSSKKEISLSDAKAMGLRPCKRCEPPR